MADTKVSNQARSAIAAVPVATGTGTVSATVTFANLTRALYVGTGGDLEVQFIDDQIVTIESALPGYHPLQVQAVGPNTTAEKIVALF